MITLITNLRVDLRFQLYQQGECVRGDGLDLVARWRALHPAGSFVTTGSELAALDTAGAEAVLGAECDAA